MNSLSGPPVLRKRERCRLCGSSKLQSFLSLGPMPPANSFLRSPQDFVHEQAYPLDVYFCETCSLVQLLDVIDPAVLFRNYIYVTGTSDTMAVHNANYARAVRADWNLGSSDLVVEVGSNDGSLLKCFNQLGMRTLGVEPATNIAEIASAAGVKTLNQFFNSTTAHDIRETYGAARVVIGNNVLAHVDDPVDFLRGCRELLKLDGLVVIEVPYLRDLLERLEYDTIYHEHLSYFSVTTLMHLCEAAGLVIVRIDYVPVHGGSLRMFARTAETYHEHAESVCNWSREEERIGLSNLAHYERFGSKVQKNRREIRELVEKLHQQGKSLAGYGAPAKGNTLLNYCGIDTDLIPYTVDKSPLKVGLYTPGTHIPVLPVSTLLERQPDYTLILAWNFADEIMEQQREYLDRGGQFIIPVPVPRIVPAANQAA